MQRSRGEGPVPLTLSTMLSAHVDGNKNLFSTNSPQPGWCLERGCGTTIEWVHFQPLQRSDISEMKSSQREANNTRMAQHGPFQSTPFPFERSPLPAHHNNPCRLPLQHQWCWAHGHHAMPVAKDDVRQIAVPDHQQLRGWAAKVQLQFF